MAINETVNCPESGPARAVDAVPHKPASQRPGKTLRLHDARRWPPQRQDSAAVIRSILVSEWLLQPCPFRFGDRDPIGGGDPPTHPLDPDLARRPWSQKCPSTTPCQSFGPRDTSPTSKIASDAAGRCPRCDDSKLTAVELGGRDGLREPQLPTPSPALATRHLLAETMESGGGAVCGHWFGDVRRQGGKGRRANEARPHPCPDSSSPSDSPQTA